MGTWCQDILTDRHWDPLSQLFTVYFLLSGTCNILHNNISFQSVWVFSSYAKHTWGVYHGQGIGEER
jgi:hypothetical protein